MQGRGRPRLSKSRREHPAAIKGASGGCPGDGPRRIAHLALDRGSGCEAMSDDGRPDRADATRAIADPGATEGVRPPVGTERQSRRPGSVCVGADDLAPADRVDPDPDPGIDRVLDEPDRAVAEATLIPPGCRLRDPAKASLSPALRGAGQLLRGLADAEETRGVVQPIAAVPQTQVVLEPVRRERVMNEQPPGTLDHIIPRTSFLAPWRTSPMKTVLLVPSVIEAREIRPSWPNAEAQVL